MGAFVALAKPILDSATAIIEQFHTSPEEKLAAQQALAETAAKVQADAQNYDIQLNATAGQNIRAEEGSGDKFTVRARPAVIWMGVLLIFWNYALVPVFGFRWHMTPCALPDAFWWTWGTVVTGYVFSRSTEKIAQMPGDSQINLGGLLKIGNKS